jgi:RNA polymerase sigma-70 factor (ECF subfamily)
MPLKPNRSGDPDERRRHTTSLVLRAQLGDRTALEDLLQTTEQRIAAYIRGVVHDSALSQDVMQNSLMIICRNLRWLNEPRAYSVWAYRIASREAFRAIRRSRRDAQALIDDVAVAEASVAMPETVSDELWAAIDQISTNRRAVLLLHYREGLTLARIADILDLPVGTVKSRLGSGLEQLRKRIREVP